MNLKLSAKKWNHLNKNLKEQENKMEKIKHLT